MMGSCHCPTLGQHQALPQESSLLASTLALLAPIIHRASSRCCGIDQKERQKRRHWVASTTSSDYPCQAASSSHYDYGLLAFSSYYHSGGMQRPRRSSRRQSPYCFLNDGERRRGSSPVHKLRLRYSANNVHDGQEPLRSGGDGTYVDLGRISSPQETDGDETLMQYQWEDIEKDQSTTSPTMEEWRSNHWIVLIDDEPAIRLAIGDYLHSGGYSVITACDGPMAFLEMLLWSCSWCITSSKAKEQGGGELDENAQDLPPPWIIDKDGKKQFSWRLPNCIISDIRMPGGIDGVQLLELLRRPDSLAAVGVNTDESSDDAQPNQPKRKRGRPKKVDTADSMYDEKDDFELLDAIVAGAADSSSMDESERIITPADQAVQYLDAIRGCIDYHSGLDLSTKVGQKKWQQRHQYPSSLQQIPVIMLTAKAMVSDRIVGYKAGANGYLPKPFRPEELLGMVDNLMRKQDRERQSWIRTENVRSDKPNNAKNNDSISGLSSDEAKVITKELIQIKKMLRAKMKQQGTAEQRRDNEKLQLLLPEATWMLRTGERRKKVFTKDHIRSILFHCFGELFPQNNTKRDELLLELEELSASHPEKLDGIV